jgi:hypothetical protein
MQRLLHLQHHRHTGHLLAHKHTSYRGLAVILVLVTGFIIGFTALAHSTADALDLYVYARNPAPIPTDPAVITNPAGDTTVYVAPLTVSGTCPVITPQVSVAIIDNGTIAGSAPCDASNQFSVVITLAAGANTLVARTFTITGDSGPDSTPVTVTYVPPVPPQPPTGTTPAPVTPTPAAPPLDIVIDEPFIVFGPDKDAVWTGSITGGTAPYRVRIDWGDGSIVFYTITKPGQQQFSHHYHVMRAYTITMQVTDHSGQSVTRQYAAVTPYVAPLTVGGNTTTPTGRSPLGTPTLIGLYGVYLLLLAGFGSLWLRAHEFAYAKVPTRPAQRATGTRRRNSTRKRS